MISRMNFAALPRWGRRNPTQKAGARVLSRCPGLWSERRVVRAERAAALHFDQAGAS